MWMDELRVWLIWNLIYPTKIEKGTKLSLELHQSLLFIASLITKLPASKLCRIFLLKSPCTCIVVFIYPSCNLSPISFRSLFWFDLGLPTFHENSNHGRENYWKSGVQIPAPEGQIFLFFFLFIFKFFTQKWISFILTTFWYLV